MDCSGTIGNILEVEIEVGQGVAHACYHDGFHDLGRFDEAPGTVQRSGVRADARFPSGRATQTRPPGLATLLVSSKRQ